MATEGAVQATRGVDEVLARSVLRHIAGDEAVHTHTAIDRCVADDLKCVGTERDHQLRAGLLGVVALDGAGGVAGGEEHAAAVDHIADHPRRATVELQTGGVRVGLGEDRHIGTDHATVLQRQDAALDAGGAGIAVVAGQYQLASALLDQATAAGDVVAPHRVGRAGINVGNHIAPVEAAGTVDRATDVEQAIAEHRIHAGRTDVLGSAQQGLPHQIVAEVGEALPDQRRRTGDQRRGERGAVVPVVAATVGIRVDRAARRCQAVAGRLAAGIRIAGQRARRKRVHRRGHQPAALQIGRRKRACHALLAGQRGQAARLAAAVIAGGEHHQATVVDHERPVFGGYLRGGRQVGPVQAAPRVVHHLHVVADQVLVDLGHAQRPTEGIALATAVIGRRLVGNDSCRDDLGAWRDTARPGPHCCAGGEAGHGGAMPDHVINRQVVPGGIDVIEVGQHATIQGHRVALHARIDDADAHALPGQAGGLCGTRVCD